MWFCFGVWVSGGLGVVEQQDSQPVHTGTPVMFKRRVDAVLSSVLRSCRTTQAQTPTLATVISTSTSSSLELEENGLSVSGLQQFKEEGDDI